MPSVPIRFVAGAVVGLLVIYPGTLDETPSALGFGLLSVRRMSRFWQAISRPRGGS